MGDIVDALNEMRKGKEFKPSEEDISAEKGKVVKDNAISDILDDYIGSNGLDVDKAIADRKQNIEIIQ